MSILLYVIIALLCVAGLFLALLSFSGQWLVVAAAFLAKFSGQIEDPGWVFIVVAIVLSVGCEVFEAFAGSWGVKRRGGSNAAGWAALAGGLVGMLVGAPVPIVGSLIGMFIGSFAFAFLVEYRRLKHHGKAAGIAWGTVIARLMSMIAKIFITLLLTAALVFLLF